MNKNDKLNEELERIVGEMINTDPKSENYKILSDRLYDIYKISNEKRKISPEVMMTVGANLFGILLIINHERLNLITSKAFSLIMKSRI